jgi:hypothetical protein
MRGCLRLELQKTGDYTWQAETYGGTSITLHHVAPSGVEELGAERGMYRYRMLTETDTGHRLFKNQQKTYIGADRFHRVIERGLRANAGIQIFDLICSVETT